MYGENNAHVSHEFASFCALELTFLIKVFGGSLCLLTCVSSPFILIVFAGVPGSMLPACAASPLVYRFLFASRVLLLRGCFRSSWPFLSWSAAIASMFIFILNTSTDSMKV